MKKYIAISVALICILVTSCGYQNLKEVNPKEQQAALLEDSQSSVLSNDEDVINIYSTKENKMIQKVIELYQAKYPNIRMEYSIGNPEKNEAMLKEMLLKKGPDIVVSDVFLEEVLLKNNVLLNLSSEINLEYNIPNFKENNNQYIIPLRFGIPFLFTKYDSQNFTINQIVENPEGFQVSNMTYDEFVELLYIYYEHDLVDQNNNINEIKLTEFIQNIVSIAKTQDIVKENENEEKFDLIKNYLEGNNTIMYHFSIGIDDIKYYLSATAIEKGKARFVQESIMPFEKIALNKNSKYKKECIDFIELALSYDIQKIDYGNGFPVNEKALDEWSNAYVVSDKEILIELENGISVKIDDPPVEEIKTMINLVKELPNIYKRDIKLLSLIQEESKKYYNEDASLVGITENIVKRYVE